MGSGLQCFLLIAPFDSSLFPQITVPGNSCVNTQDRPQCLEFDSDQFFRLAANFGIFSGYQKYSLPDKLNFCFRQARFIFYNRPHLIFTRNILCR